MRRSLERVETPSNIATPAEVLIRAEDGNYFGRVSRRETVLGLHMAETLYEPNARIPSHQHESPSLFMPLQGTFVEGCDSTTNSKIARHLHPSPPPTRDDHQTTIRHYGGGDVGFHPPYETHWLQAPTQRGRGFAIEIGPEWSVANEAFPVWDQIPRDLSHSPVAWLVGRLYQELHAGDTASRLVIETLGTEIHAHLTAATQLPSARPPHWLRRVIEMLHDDAAPTLRALAQLAGVTPVALIRTFRRHMGVTPGVYLRSLRLTNARRALLETDRTLVTIALDAGFYDQSHFVRAFKEYAGIAPGSYRQLFRRSSVDRRGPSPARIV